MDVLMAPNPETISCPGEQAPFFPLAVLQVGALWGLMPIPPTVGLFKYVRLKILVNSARTVRPMLSRIRNCRPNPEVLHRTALARGNRHSRSAHRIGRARD